MAKNKSFLQEAIASAKEIREAAVKSAYKELEENITPSIKEALAQKLDEELELDEGNGYGDFTPVKEPKPKKTNIKEEEDEEQPEQPENGDEQPEDQPEEPVDQPTGEEPEEDPQDPTEEPEPEETGESAEDGPSDDTELGDMTVGDLKELIASLVSTISGNPATAEQPEDMQPGNVEGQGEEEPIEGGDEPIEQPAADQPMEEPTQEPVEDQPQGKDREEDVEIDLSELLKELEEEEKDRKVVTHSQDSEEGLKKQLEEAKEAAKTAYKVVAELKEALRESNLLNAKLTCTSKLLAKPLTEGQKVRAIRSLDEAKTGKEVKAVYETLVECFNDENKQKKSAKRGTLTEHNLGSASRAAGKSTAAPATIEADPVVRRFQELAGIIK